MHIEISVDVDMHSMHSMLKEEIACLQDFQFFNQGRLTEIYAKEAAYENFRWQQAQKKDTVQKQVRPNCEFAGCSVPPNVKASAPTLTRFQPLPSCA